jgi:hypothetical protein
MLAAGPLRVGCPCDATQGLGFGFNRTFELGCGTRPTASNSPRHPPLAVARKYLASAHPCYRRNWGSLPTKGISTKGAANKKSPKQIYKWLLTKRSSATVKTEYRHPYHQSSPVQASSQVH